MSELHPEMVSYEVWYTSPTHGQSILKRVETLDEALRASREQTTKTTIVEVTRKVIL